MNLIDILIPLIIGILLVACPHMFTQKAASAEEAAEKQSTLRKIGYVLLGVAVLFFILKLASPR